MRKGIKHDRCTEFLKCRRAPRVCSGRLQPPNFAAPYYFPYSGRFGINWEHSASGSTSFKYLCWIYKNETKAVAQETVQNSVKKGAHLGSSIESERARESRAIAHPLPHSASPCSSPGMWMAPP